MKTTVIFSFTLLFALHLHAQIVLNATDLPKAGDVNVSVKVDSVQAANLSPGNAGAEIVWDFSTLLPCCDGSQYSYDTLTWILPLNTLYYSAFPLSNLAYKKIVTGYIHTKHIRMRNSVTILTV